MRELRYDRRNMVTLIGMPTAGKTKIGKLLAQDLGCRFVDIDDVLVRHFNAKNLQEVVNRLPPAEFANAEEAAAIQTATESPVPTIIATGGSVVHLREAMNYLSQHTHIIHLHISLDTAIRRVAKRPDRGIVFAPGETLADLYKRRMPLYEKWAHRTVNTDRGRSKVAWRLAKQLEDEGYLIKTMEPRLA